MEHLADFDHPAAPQFDAGHSTNYDLIEVANCFDRYLSEDRTVQMSTASRMISGPVASALAERIAIAIIIEGRARP